MSNIEYYDILYAADRTINLLLFLMLINLLKLIINFDTMQRANCNDKNLNIQSNFSVGQMTDFQCQFVHWNSRDFLCRKTGLAPYTTSIAHWAKYLLLKMFNRIFINYDNSYSKYGQTIKNIYSKYLDNIRILKCIYWKCLPWIVFTYKLKRWKIDVLFFTWPIFNF